MAKIQYKKKKEMSFMYISWYQITNYTKSKTIVVLV